jgi:outer membrane receptor for ferrienterochelin and colicin
MAVIVHLTGSMRSGSMSRRLVLAAILLMGVATAAQAGAQSQEAEEPLSLAELGEVEVYAASKRRQSIGDAPASVTVITAAEIDAFRYRTLADVLRAVPGFFVTSDRNYDYVAVRGFGRPGDYNTRILLLIDGARINDAVYDMASVDRELPVDIALLERVEVVRGPGSALYGTSAFFAVVNLITRNGSADPGFQADLGAAGLGLRRGAVAWGGNVAGADVLVSATALTKAGDSRLYFPEFMDTDSLGIAHDADGEKTRGVFASVSRSGFDLTIAHNARDKTVPTAPYETLFNDSRTSTRDVRTHVALAWDGRDGALVGRMRYGRYEYRGAYAYEDYLSRDRALAEWIAGEVTSVKAVGSSHTLTSGIEIQRDLRRLQEDGDGSRPGGPGWRSAVFIQDEWRWGHGFTAHLGARYDRYSRAGQRLSPRLGIVWRGTDLTLKALAGEAFRAPNEYELHYYPATPLSLGPETIRTMELVAEASPWKRMRLGASVFRNQVRGLIELDGSGDAFFFRNVGRAVTTGFELQLQTPNLSGFSGRASYSLQRTTDEGSGVVLTNSPRHLAAFTITRPFAQDRFQAALELRGLSTRMAPSGASIGGHVVANAHLTARFKRHFEAVASVYDAFDQRYSDPASEEHRQHGIPQEGRTFAVQVRIRAGR